MKVVKFAYYDEFHCIGPECSETCCQHWDIFFRRREYINFKNAKCSIKLKNAMDNAFTRIKDGDEMRYAQIKFDENGYCPLLDSDGLCMVQKELGENALNMVCSTFPRQTVKVGNEALIYSCNITCSHVAEILMNHPEGLALVEEEYKHNDRWAQRGIYTGIVSAECKGYPYFFLIKNAQLDILQNRNFTISERMLILGFFCQKADEYITANQGEKIQGLANMLLDNEMCRKIADSLKAPQSDESAALKSVDILAKMWKGIEWQDISTYLRKLFDQVFNSIDFSIEENEYDTKYSTLYNAEKYAENVEVYRKIESERPYIFENLLVNLIFTQDFSQGAWANFFELAVFYNTFKICIPAFLKESWTDKELALAITYAAKMVINTKLAQNSITANFTRNNSYDLPHAAFLIS